LKGCKLADKTPKFERKFREEVKSRNVIAFGILNVSEMYLLVIGIEIVWGHLYHQASALS
jgi:hypothetical protein